MLATACNLSAVKPANRKSQRPGRSKARMAAQAQLATSSAPGVQQLAAQSPAFAAALAAQDAVLERVTSQLGLAPVQHPGADPTGAMALSSEGSDGLSAVVQAVRGGAVRWLSASALANPTLGFGTTRLMGWVDSSNDIPHLVLEFGVVGSGAKGRAQGTLSLAQRSDLFLDGQYVERYYNRAPPSQDQASPLRTWNDVFNETAARQAAGWQVYQVPQARMKPLIANSISYAFPAQEAEVAAFGAAALEVAVLWAAFLLKQGGQGAAGTAFDPGAVAAYDAAHERFVREDPGNEIATKVLGAEATAALLDMTCGPKS